MKIHKFLRLSVALCLFLILFSSCASPHSETGLTRYEFERPEMGMAFRIVLYAPEAASAKAAADAAFGRIQQLNDVMSDYDPDSELSKLSLTSGQGRAIPVSRDLWNVLERAQTLSEKSRGAFDITVGPYVILWRKARREQIMPDLARLDAARKAVGYQKVKLNLRQHTVELLSPGMRLDLGGIAKGYALDEAKKVLLGHNIHRVMVEGGGDLVVSDSPPGKDGWRIQLSPLDVTNAPPPQFLLLRHTAISTSGDLYQRVEIDGKRYSHIVDPRTGIGLTNHALVNVIARDSMTADSLTKVVSVLIPSEGLKLIEETPGVSARIARQPAGKLEIYETSRFSGFYTK